MEGSLRDPGLRLIETFAWDGTRVPRLEAHLARARGSARDLGFRWDEAAIGRALASLDAAAPQRVRLTVGRAGDVQLTMSPLLPSPALWHLAVHPDRLDERAPARRHKTTDRAPYDRARAALPSGIDEFIFLNRHGQVAEGTITNLFFDLGGGLLTPPLSSGCLPGILRAELLGSGQARQEVLPAAALPRARLWVGNALRGLIPAVLQGHQAAPR